MKKTTGFSVLDHKKQSWSFEVTTYGANFRIHAKLQIKIVAKCMAHGK